MILTTQEHADEAHAAKDGTRDRSLGAADWKSIAESYEAKGRSECCCFCEAGRAYNRAASDYKKARMMAEYEDALASAASAFERCGDHCFEEADFDCAELGLLQAKLVFERIKKNAEAAANPAAVTAATADIDRISQAIDLFHQQKLWEFLDRLPQELKAAVISVLKSTGTAVPDWLTH